MLNSTFLRKAISFLIVCTAFIVATNASAFVYLRYQLHQDDVTKVTFPIKINKTELKKKYYYAMQFHLKNKGNGAYIGMQPLKDAIGARFIFSVFGKGTENLYPQQCKGGADGGAGVSCAMTLDTLELDKTYYLTVLRDKKDARIWKGYVSTNKQALTPESGLIGIWKARKGAGNIAQGDSGFIENFRPTHSIDDLTALKAEFQPPFSNGEADQRGKITGAGLNGRWKKVVEQHFTFKSTAKGGVMIDYRPPAEASDKARVETEDDAQPTDDFPTEEMMTGVNSPRSE